MGYGMQGNKIPEGYQTGKLSNWEPWQQDIAQQLRSNIGPNSLTQKLASGDQSQFDQMEAPAWRTFNEASAQNASRFSGMGLGARGGSGFKNSQSAAASNFAQDLQSKRLELQRQAINDIMGYGNQLLGQKPYNNFLVQDQPETNYWGDIAGKFAGAIPGAIAGFASGGPPGAAVGAATSFASNVASKNPQSGSQQIANYQLNPYAKGY